VIVQGTTSTGTVETELAIVAQATPTSLSFATPLQHKYVRGSVRIFGNAGAATHGETVREVLGSGDASVSFQRFRLSHAPLTYVYDSSEPDGAASTLSVFVNDIRWKEVATLHGAGRYDHVYVTRRDDDGNTYVQFGDGRTAGPRAPTGTNNIRAVYRKGIGPDGNVGSGRITLLMSRPLGLDGVGNPLAATGGSPPQVLADARKNAPRTVLTLDRVVSLIDYQAFAAAFAGIAKAVATSTVTRNVRQVFLTVAGPGGVTFAPGDATLKALRDALVAQGKPYLPLRVLSYEAAPFNLSASVAVAADHVADLVLPKVRAAVRSAFSFDARSFGEAVDRSDIVKVIHSVDGVVSVDIDALYHTGDTVSLEERLSARMPEQRPDGVLVPAQILILGNDDIREKTS
jgi:predicted phage baseplate assembly protein